MTLEVVRKDKYLPVKYVGTQGFKSNYSYDVIALGEEAASNLITTIFLGHR